VPPAGSDGMKTSFRPSSAFLSLLIPLSFVVIPRELNQLIRKQASSVKSIEYKLINLLGKKVPAI